MKHPWTNGERPSK
jgi:hypothetical protein